MAFEESEDVLLKPYRRGVRKYLMIQDLAMGELTQAQVAQKYGVTQPAVYKFMQRNQAAIDEVRSNLENELHQFWIVKKAARIAAYQGGVEHLTELVDEVSPEKVPPFYRTIHQALASVAEELGQLPQRAQQAPDQHEVVHKVVGVDPSEMV